MSENESKVQLSGNIGAGYFILKADSVAELKQLASDWKEQADEIYTLLGAVQQVTLVKEVFSEKQNNKPQGGFAPKAAGGAPAAGGANTGGKVRQAPDGKYICDHGAATELDYIKKDGSGDRVNGFYCGSKDRNIKKCAPVKR